MIIKRDLKIELVDNGYVLSWKEYNDANELEDFTKVIEDVEDEKETMKYLLESVATHFFVPYDKWGRHNLKITFDGKGSKVE